MLRNLTPFDQQDPVRILLLISDEEDASRIRSRLEEDQQRAEIIGVPSFGAAMQVLKEEQRFDIVVVDHDLPDGTSLDLLGRVDIVGPALPVLVLFDSAGEDVAVSVMKAGAADYVRRVQEGAYETEVSFKVKEALHRYRLLEHVQQLAQEHEQLRFIETVRATVANVKHEINNPLSIISGNAQFLLELARFYDLDEEFKQSLQDIEEASQRIAASLDKLVDLKDVLTRRYVDEEASV